MDAPKYPPLVENLDASTFHDFHEVPPTSSSAGGWTYLAATPPSYVSSYLYAYNWPLGFTTDAHNFGECLVINPDGPYGVAMMRNYSLTTTSGGQRWECDTDHRTSQGCHSHRYKYSENGQNSGPLCHPGQQPSSRE